MRCWNKIPAPILPALPPSWPSANGRWCAACRRADDAGAGDQAEALLADLASWGQVTTIVESDGSIFEVKAPFPKGKTARGYYNLMGRDGEMHGHLKLDNVVGIALVSKLFMGKEGHSFQFFGHSGRCI